MSLILDALNRADQERSKEQNPLDLNAALKTPVKPQRPIGRWIAEALILIVAVIGILVYLGVNRPPEDKASAVTAKLPAVDRSASPATQTQTQAQASQPSATVANTPLETNSKQQISDLYQQPIEDSPDAFSATTNTTAAPQQTASAASIASKPVTPQSVAEPAPEPPPTIDKQIIFQQTPFLHQLPKRFQDSVPSIDYSLHVFSDEDGGGLVKLNGEIKRAGALVVRDIRIIEVLEDSVVLAYQGRQFRLRALNSWVNLN